MPTTWEPIEDPGQLKDVRLRLMLSHWSAAAAIGRIPPRTFVDQATLGDLMGWLFVYRVERDPMRFLYILCGPKIVRRLGVQLSGKYVDEHPDPAAREVITGALTAAVETRRPHRVVSIRRLLDQDITTEVLVLPLAGPDDIVDHVIASQILETAGDT